jgi:hypothetical protein
MRLSVTVTLLVSLSAIGADALSAQAAAQSTSKPAAEQPKTKAADKKESAKQAMDQKMDHNMDHAAMQPGKMGKEMAMSPWKELDAYHELMMATWHPAKDKNDLAPMRAKAAAMVTAANVLAASTAPKGCDAPKLKSAAAALPGETKAVADLVTAKADDVSLKAALKGLHEKFDVLEMGCTMPKAPAK